jgi:hypothetical protein
MNGGGQTAARLLKQDTEILEAALIGFQHKRDQIEQKIAELRSQIRGTPASRPAPAAAAPGASVPKKRTMSAAARRRIAMAQKKRWAAYKAAQGTKAAAPKQKKRAISAEGRARIVAATKKRWAAFRKQEAAGRGRIAAAYRKRPAALSGDDPTKPK